MRTPPDVVVHSQNWKPKSTFYSDALINWVLPPELFVEAYQDFNYELAILDYFDSGLVYSTDETATNLASAWFGLNNFAAYPANNGIMKTPVSWFVSLALFSTDVATGWTQVRLGSGSNNIFWILAAFAGFVSLKQRGG